jgi:hypothetical protein
MMDEEALFLKNEYSLCADIDRHLSIASRNHMLLNAEYRKAKLERHAVNMWTTIVKSHTTTSNALMNKIKARNLIECCKQNGRHIEAYCIEYLEKIEEAKLLGDKSDEEELALKFLLHLDPTYSEKVQKLVNDDGLPKTVANAQLKAIAWSETKALVEPEMGIKSKAETPLESVANFANNKNKNFKNNKKQNGNNHNNSASSETKSDHNNKNNYNKKYNNNSTNNNNNSTNNKSANNNNIVLITTIVLIIVLITTTIVLIIAQIITTIVIITTT